MAAADPIYFTQRDRATRRERLIQAYQAGAAERELAERFAYSENYVYRIVRNAGVSRSRRAGRRG
jgi:Mor family transcriptional regulator